MRRTSSLEEEEEEEMPLERKKGSSLHELLMGGSKGSAFKDASGSQLPPPPPSASPFAPANLKKRKKDKEVVKEGKLVPYNEGIHPKVSKMAIGRQRGSSTESKKVEHMAEVCPLNPAWNLRLELDGAAISWNSIIREFQKGNTHYLSNALEQPFFLPKNMAALKNLKQKDLFLSLKRDLALVGLSTCLTNSMLGYLFSYLIGHSFVVFVQEIQEVFMVEEW